MSAARRTPPAIASTLAEGAHHDPSPPYPPRRAWPVRPGRRSRRGHAAARLRVQPPPDTDRQADGSVTLIVQPPPDQDREADIVVGNPDVGRVDVGITVFTPPPD